MSGNLVQNIPHVTKEEWTIILANCTEEQHITMINVYQRPGSLMPNHGSGRATPTRAYQQILGNIFNEQVRLGEASVSGNNNQIPISNMARQPHTHVPTSNLNMQGQVRISGQTMQNNPPQISGGQIPPMSYWTPNPSNTFSLQQTSAPMISVPALRPPRSIVTSTINTLIDGNPRMSSGVTTAPTSFMPSNSFFFKQIHWKTPHKAT